MKKWSNAWIFRDLYWEHCGASAPWLRSAISEGRGEEVTKGWIQYVQSIRHKSLLGMKDVEGVTVLRMLKDRLYKQRDGPGWDELYEQALSAGCKPGDDACRWIAEWLIRTHGPPVDERNRWYKAVLKPVEEFRRIKAQSLHWMKTEKAEYPWECTFEEWHGLIRIGDFPIEHLYHVYCDGQEVGVTDDWPANWTRESWVPSGIGTKQVASGVGVKGLGRSSDDIAAQIDRIITKLARLRDLDWECSFFGSRVHKYRLGTPLSEQEVSEFEKRLRMDLPSEYRCFLMRVGHGGAGPYYGLFRLDGEDPEDITDLDQVRKPFRWNEAFNACDWEDPCSPEDVWCEELESEDIEEGVEPQVMLKIPGALYICDCGCAIRCFLIVQGERVGEVWCDSQADEGGVAPECGEDGVHLGFLDWYEKWVDGGITAVSSIQTRSGSGS